MFTVSLTIEEEDKFASRSDEAKTEVRIHWVYLYEFEFDP